MKDFSKSERRKEAQIIFQPFEVEAKEKSQRLDLFFSFLGPMFYCNQSDRMRW
jgi:hypothetical protein